MTPHRFLFGQEPAPSAVEPAATDVTEHSTLPLGPMLDDRPTDPSSEDEPSFDERVTDPTPPPVVTAEAAPTREEMTRLTEPLFVVPTAPALPFRPAAPEAPALDARASTSTLPLRRSWGTSGEVVTPTLELPTPASRHAAVRRRRAREVISAALVVLALALLVVLALHRAPAGPVVPAARPVTDASATTISSAVPAGFAASHAAETSAAPSVGSTSAAPSATTPRTPAPTRPTSPRPRASGHTAPVRVGGDVINPWAE